MKRFLSWLALIFCMNVFYYLDYFFWILAIYVFNAIYNFSEVLFWVLAVCEGATTLFIIVAGVVLGGNLTVKASQAINASKNGARYIALPSIIITFCVISMIGLPAGYVRGTYFLAFAWLITMIIYSISVLVTGTKKAKEQQLT